MVPPAKTVDEFTRGASRIIPAQNRKRLLDLFGVLDAEVEAAKHTSSPINAGPAESRAGSSAKRRRPIDRWSPTSWSVVYFYLRLLTFIRVCTLSVSFQSSSFRPLDHNLYEM
eukprot:GHVP01003070.1.p1 GENE.GHVP01003070.1~~GHVP01003070.1.p1  ORF type:complete len:113 (-),score=9.13 GHVP01003070.1:1533-1871(-)